MRTFLLAFALFLALSATVSAADPSTYLDEADRHWGAHPCAGQVQPSFSSQAEGTDEHGREIVGRATGIKAHQDGTWVLIDCTIAINQAKWEHFSPEYQCAIVVHEVGHLAMHRHEEGGVMAADVTDYVIPSVCDFRTPRERAIDALLAHTKTDTIACGKQKGKVFYCRTDSPTGQRRFRVRAHAGGIAWREVRLSKRATVVRFR